MIPNVKQTSELAVLIDEYKYNPFYSDKVISLIPSYPYFRRIRGDGNCCYRAAMYGYLERLTLLGPPAIQAFAKLLNEGEGFYTLKGEQQGVKATLLHVLEVLANTCQSSGPLSALQELLKNVLINSAFDNSMIRFLRRTVANFILLKPNLSINGIPLHCTVQGEYRTMQECVEKLVLKDKEDATSGIHAVIPLVLRISLVYVVLDSSDRSTTGPIKQKYSANNPASNNIFDDGLDFHDDQITLLYNPGHYDLLYQAKYIDQYPVLLKYDSIYQSIIMEDMSRLGACAICNHPIQSSAELCRHQCSPMHNYCLNDFILKLTGDRVLYTKEEAKRERLRKCPICNETFENSDLKRLFDKEACNIFKERKKERKNKEENNNMDITSDQKSLQKKSSLEPGCKLCRTDYNDEEEMYLHSCKAGYVHYRCMLKWWNENLGKSLRFLAEQNQQKSLKCPLCYEPINKEDLNKILAFERRTSIRNSGTEPPVLRRPLVEVDKRPLPRIAPREVTPVAPLHSHAKETVKPEPVVREVHGQHKNTFKFQVPRREPRWASNNATGSVMQKIRMPPKGEVYKRVAQPMRYVGRQVVQEKGWVKEYWESLELQTKAIICAVSGILIILILWLCFVKNK